MAGGRAEKCLLWVVIINILLMFRHCWQRRKKLPYRLWRIQKNPAFCVSKVWVTYFRLNFLPLIFRNSLCCWNLTTKFNFDLSAASSLQWLEQNGSKHAVCVQWTVWHTAKCKLFRFHCSLIEKSERYICITNATSTLATNFDDDKKLLRFFY